MLSSKHDRSLLLSPLPSTSPSPPLPLFYFSTYKYQIPSFSLIIQVSFFWIVRVGFISSVLFRSFSEYFMIDKITSHRHVRSFSDL